MKYTSVETPGVDGHIHVIPTTGPEHEESERCWCKPQWDEKNRAEYGRSFADFKVFVHKSIAEVLQ